MSIPPNAPAVRSITCCTPSGRLTSAVTARTPAPSPAASDTAFSASRSAASPRAQRHTRHPSAASDLALANPSPRLEPVTIAILSLSPRSTSRRLYLSSFYGRGLQCAIRRTGGADQVVLAVQPKQPGRECDEMAGTGRQRQHRGPSRYWYGPAGWWRHRRPCPASAVFHADRSESNRLHRHVEPRADYRDQRRTC